jgi:DNA-directed RNA polymerase subunit omega
MARITVEDCLMHVRNRFELVHVAAKRVRQLLKGSRPLVDNTFTQNRTNVVALREVAAGNVRPASHKPTAE